MAPAARRASTLDLPEATASNGTGAQQWQKGTGNTPVNPASGRCLDATGPSSANGTRLQIWDCTGAANQQWTLPTA